VARVRRGAAAMDGGVHWPGIYAAMLAREREFVARYDRVLRADPNDPDAGFFRVPRGRLDELEAGEPVVVRAVEVRSPGRGLSEPPALLRLDPHAWVAVHPDDRIVPAASPVVDPIRQPVARRQDWRDALADDYYDD
jgi:hypothetical protein